MILILEGVKKTADLRAGDRNPYSWNMDFLPYNDGSGYEARFYTCGICALMKEYGFMIWFRLCATWTIR